MGAILLDSIEDTRSYYSKQEIKARILKIIIIVIKMLRFPKCERFHMVITDILVTVDEALLSNQGKPLI